MLRFMILIYLLSFSLSLAATAADGNKVYWELAKLDKLKNKKPRYLIDSHGAYLVKGIGAQIHPTCFQFGQDRKVMEKFYQQVFKDAAQKIINCKKRYPELNKYLDQWISHYRRSVFSCKDSMKAGAMNMSTGGKIIYPDQSRGVDYPQTFISAPSKYKTFTVMNQNFVDGALKSGFVREQFVDLVIHEIMHSTQANNHGGHTHWKVENTDLWQKGRCGKDISTDRIQFISRLCSGVAFPVNYEKATRIGIGPSDSFEEQVYNKATQCGGQCETTLSNGYGAGFQNLIQEYYLPSSGLSKNKAKAVCERIQDIGRCKRDEQENIPFYNKKLRKLARKAVVSIESMFPSWGISHKWIKANPKVKKATDQLMNINGEYAAPYNRCIRKVIRKVGDGLLFNTKSVAGRHEKRQFNEVIENMAIVALEKLKSSTDCEEVSEIVRGHFIELENQARELEQSIGHNTLLVFYNREQISIPYAFGNPPELQNNIHFQNFFHDYKKTINSQMSCDPSIKNAATVVIKSFGRKPAVTSKKCMP